MTLEIELGVTGGEEDGVDNSGIDNSKLYTQPERRAGGLRRAQAGGLFTVAASFGNTHGVYAPGNVKLTPEILQELARTHIQEERKTGPKPVDFVFHGGSGSTPEEIREAVSYGVVKMNIDTDTQWAFTQPDQEVHGREGRLPAVAARQPRGRRQAQQEVHRPARLAAPRREGHDRAPGPGLQGPGRVRQVRLLVLARSPRWDPRSSWIPGPEMGATSIDDEPSAAVPRAMLALSALAVGVTAPVRTSRPASDDGNHGPPWARWWARPGQSAQEPSRRTCCRCLPALVLPDALPVLWRRAVQALFPSVEAAACGDAAFSACGAGMRARTFSSVARWPAGVATLDGSSSSPSPPSPVYDGGGWRPPSPVRPAFR